MHKKTAIFGALCGLMVGLACGVIYFQGFSDPRTPTANELTDRWDSPPDYDREGDSVLVEYRVHSDQAVGFDDQSLDSPTIAQPRVYMKAPFAAKFGAAQRNYMMLGLGIGGTNYRAIEPRQPRTNIHEGLRSNAGQAVELIRIELIDRPARSERSAKKASPFRVTFPCGQLIESLGNEGLL